MEGGIELRMSGRAWATLLALATLWGGTFFLSAVALRDLPPFTIVAARLALAAVALHVTLAALGRPLRAPPRLWAAFLGMGLINNAIPFSLIVWGQTQIASSLAAILNAATPVFGVLVAHALTRDEKLTPARLGGVALGFAGVATLVGPAALAGLGGAGTHGAALGQAAILGAALSYAFAGAFGRRFRRLGVSPEHTAAGQLTGSSLLMLPAALVLDRPWTLPPPGAETLAAVAGLALLGTALAYLLYFRLLALAGSGNTLLVTLLVPVGAILLGVGVLGETLEARHLGGMALIAAGLAAIDGRPLAALRPRRRPAARPRRRA